MRKRFPQNSPWIMANLTFKTSNRLVITTSTRIFISPLLCSIMYFSYHFAVSFVCMNVNQIRSSNKKLIKRLRKELGQFWHGNRSSYKSMRDIYFLMMINVCMLYLYTEYYKSFCHNMVYYRRKGKVLPLENMKHFTFRWKKFYEVYTINQYIRSKYQQQWDDAWSEISIRWGSFNAFLQKGSDISYRLTQRKEL